MIAKILPSIPTFEAVRYNEKKNEKGTGELLTAKNFPLYGQSSISDYMKYMEAVAKTNPRVKNVQFHAVISCKGRENTPEELREVAEKYMEKMGYGQNPILIYSHSDTDNNHVHIVSTRVDKKGQKIDDSFERIRSQEVMREILGVDLKQKAKEDLAFSLSFDFATIAQFKMLLEKKGWSIQEDKSKLYMWRGGEKFSVNKKIIEDKIKKYSPDENRTKQLTALFHKYKEGLDHQEFQKLMKNKFGVELIYHTGKGHNLPYGYTVIDYKDKTVYKGNSIMNVKDLLINPERQEKINTCNQLILAILKDEKLSFNSFKALMEDYGYDVSTQGGVKLKGEDDYLFNLTQNLLKELKYNGRLEQANNFMVKSKAEANVISKLFYVKARDITLYDNLKSVNNELYTEMMKSYLYNNKEVIDALQRKQISFIKDRGEVFLVDMQNRVILNSRDLDIHFEQRIKILDSGNFERYYKEVDKSYDYELLDIIEYVLYSQEEQEGNKRKRKNKKQRKKQ